MVAKHAPTMSEPPSADAKSQPTPPRSQLHHKHKLGNEQTFCTMLDTVRRDEHKGSSRGKEKNIYRYFFRRQKVLLSHLQVFEVFPPRHLQRHSHSVQTDVELLFSFAKANNSHHVISLLPRERYFRWLFDQHSDCSSPYPSTKYKR